MYSAVVVTDSNNNFQLADRYSNCVTDMVVRLHYTNTHVNSRALVSPNMCDSLVSRTSVKGGGHTHLVDGWIFDASMSTRKQISAIRCFEQYNQNTQWNNL